MHKRSSIDKAEWGLEREEWYRNEGERIAFISNAELLIIHDSVYVKTDKTQTLLCEPTKTKTLWYETWLKLMYPNN